MKSTLLLLLSILIMPLFVYAHPIDEIDGIKTYDQKQIITVKSDKIILNIDLTFYALDKTRIWDSIDTNKDRLITSEEQLIWMKKGRQSSWLVFENIKSEFVPSALTFPEYYDFFSVKPAKVIIVFESKHFIKPPTHIEYFYKGKDKVLSQIDIKVEGSDQIAIETIKKRTSNSLYISLKKGTGMSSAVPGIKATDAVSSFLNTYIKSENVSFNLQVYALFTALILGAIHALTPGHGKAITAGYLVGSKGTLIHAVYLGVIITVTHTASVFILGAITLFLSAYIVPATIIKSLNLISGMLIVGFGLSLLLQRIKYLIEDRNILHEHTKLQNKPLTFKHLLAFGISGGIVPCVDALAILLVAVSLQKIIFGLLILLTFSIGLSAALTVSGMLAITAQKKVFQRFERLNRIEHYLGIISAVVVTILGIILLIKL